MQLEQKFLCNQYQTEFLSSPDHYNVGIALNVRSGILPIHGLRHPPEKDTTGWYIWAGEDLSENPDFFQPLHVEHLREWCPAIQKFLGLPAGWRFLIADNYEDVLFDKNLLEIEI